MGLLFGGKPEEVPFRRKVLRSLVYAGMKAMTFAIIAPVLMILGFDPWRANAAG